MIFFPMEWLVILIIVLILSIIVGVNYIINNIVKVILCILMIVTFITVSLGLLRLFEKLYERDENGFFYVGFSAVSVFWLLGPVFFMEFVFLDKSDVFFSIFGQHHFLRYIAVPMVIGLMISIGFLLAAYNVKRKFVQSLLCICSAISIGIFILVTANICTKSYSDEIVQKMVSEKTRKYVVLNKATIYYPSICRGRNWIRFPFFSPIKFSSDCFKEGDIVYANPDDYTSNSEFIMVTDGVKAGLIEKDALWNQK